MQSVRYRGEYLILGLGLYRRNKIEMCRWLPETEKWRRKRKSVLLFMFCIKHYSPSVYLYIGGHLTRCPSECLCV